MNRKRLSLCAAGMLCLSALLFNLFAQDVPVPTPPPGPGEPGVPHMGGRHHPAIRAAIMALQRAKAEMQAAAHDYGGHRADAIAACDTAIAQLNLALQYANQNNPSGQPTPTPVQ
jgi:Spy/CpxP family protein refolding chaperone